MFCNAHGLSVLGAHLHLGRAYLSHIVGHQDPAEGAGYQPEKGMERQYPEIEKTLRFGDFKLSFKLVQNLPWRFINERCKRINGY